MSNQEQKRDSAEEVGVRIADMMNLLGRSHATPSDAAIMFRGEAVIQQARTADALMEIAAVLRMIGANHARQGDITAPSGHLSNAFDAEEF